MHPTYVCISSVTFFVPSYVTFFPIHLCDFPYPVLWFFWIFFTHFCDVLLTQFCDFSVTNSVTFSYLVLWLFPYLILWRFLSYTVSVFSVPNSMTFPHLILWHFLHSVLWLFLTRFCDFFLAEFCDFSLPNSVTFPSVAFFCTCQAVTRVIQHHQNWLKLLGYPHFLSEGPPRNTISHHGCCLRFELRQRHQGRPPPTHIPQHKSACMLSTFWTETPDTTKDEHHQLITMSHRGCYLRSKLRHPTPSRKNTTNSCTTPSGIPC